MNSIDRYQGWASDKVAATLWAQKGPKNTDIAELRCIVMGDDGHTAIAVIYKGENGFMVYRETGRTV